MKHAPVHSKVTPLSTSASLSRPVTGPQGIALAPPTYGIDFVDRQQSTGVGMAIQRQVDRDSGVPEKQSENRTGLPDQLKAGIENLSELSLDDVRVHYNSTKPAALEALAYTQGTDIHVGPGQEQHLPHEAWHVVQQMQGRVLPRFQLKGEPVNDDKRLEHEADMMGKKALQRHRPDPVTTGSIAQTTAAEPLEREPAEAAEATGKVSGASEEKGAANFPSPFLSQRVRKAEPFARPGLPSRPVSHSVIQRDVGFEFEMNWAVKAPSNTIGMDTDIVTGTRWHAEPDMKALPPELQNQTTYTGYGSLEFVTDAFLETDAGRFDLAFTLNQITNFVSGIADSWYGYGLTGWGDVPLVDFVSPPIAWGGVTAGLLGRNRIMIERKGSKGTASAQMSAGIRLEKVSEVIRLMGTPTGGSPDLFGRAAANPLLAPMRATLTQVQGRAHAQAVLHQGLMNAADTLQYEGALAHLGSIVAFAATVANLEKTKYLHPLLSRTNFGNLPLVVRNHVNLKEDVIIASGLGTALNWAGILGNQLFPHSQNLSAMSIDAWLNGIIGGNDTLNWGQKPLAAWNPAVVGPVGHQSVGHVYEFRGIQPGGLPVDQWRTWALDRFDYVRNTLNQ